MAGFLLPKSSLKSHETGLQFHHGTGKRGKMRSTNGILKICSDCTIGSQQLHHHDYYTGSWCHPREQELQLQRRTPGLRASPQNRAELSNHLASFSLAPQVTSGAVSGVGQSTSLSLGFLLRVLTIPQTLNGEYVNFLYLL